MLADTFCPECHGRYELALVRATHLVKHCSECGHRWNEVREGATLEDDGSVTLAAPAAEPLPAARPLAYVGTLAIRKGNYIDRFAV